MAVACYQFSMMTQGQSTFPGRWVAVVLLAAVVAVGLRVHAFHEPLDCDEAAYAYVAHRLLQGGTPYVDVIENKPPLAYGVFSLAFVLGGYSESSIRLLSFPFMLATLVGVAVVAGHLFGPRASGVAAVLFAITSCDPFLFADSANLEVFLNAFLIWSFYAALKAADSNAACGWLAAGVLTAGASLVKQTVVPHIAVYLFWAAVLPAAETQRKRPIRRAGWLLGGFLAPWLAVCAWAMQGGFFWEMVHFLAFYGPGMAAETQDAGIVSRLATFVTGRADDRWWGTGTWPLLLAGAMAFIANLTTGRRKPTVLAATWLSFCALEVFLPGLHWQHYYMLLLPGLCLLASSLLANDHIATDQGSSRIHLVRVGTVSLCIVGCGALQWQHFLRLSPEEVMVRHKGGEQWLLLRQMGQQFGESIRQAQLPDPYIFVWGIQTPLYVYSRLDSPTAKVLTDPLQEKYLNSSFPLVDPIRNQIIADLYADPPEVIFVGTAPFVQLEQLLRDHYTSATSQTAVASSQGRGVYLRKDILAPLTDAARRRLPEN